MPALKLRGKNATRAAKGLSLVDKAVYNKVKTISPVWHVDKSGYAVTRKKIDGKWKTIYMHRVVEDVKHGERVYHSTSNRTDNRRRNLIIR